MMDPRQETAEEAMAEALAESSTMVTLEEVRAFMKQALHRGSDLSQALTECFRAPAPIHDDRSVAHGVTSAARELWAVLSELYDPAADAVIAPLRDRALRLVQRQMDWIRSLDARGIDPRDLPPQEISSLGEISSLLVGVLDTAERDTEADVADRDRLIETLDGMEPALEELIDQVESHLEQSAEVDREAKSRDEQPAEAVYVFKVSLKDIRPPVWRRLRLPGDETLGDFHRAIQVAMDWDDDHLHEFRVGDHRYTDPYRVDDLYGALNEHDVALDELDLRERQRLSYVYDFGDDWVHTIVVERVVPYEEWTEGDPASVVCLAGKNAAPPEDSGGPFGFEDTLTLEGEETLDPNAFDIDEVNRRLDPTDEGDV